MQVRLLSTGQWNGQGPEQRNRLSTSKASLRPRPKLEILSRSVLPIAAVSRRIRHLTVLKDTHDLWKCLSFPAPIAFPIMRSFSFVTSALLEVPRLKTRDRSTLLGNSARSRSTSRRKYSAREMPRAAARARILVCNSESIEICVRTIIAAPLCSHSPLLIHRKHLGCRGMVSISRAPIALSVETPMN